MEVRKDDERMRNGDATSQPIIAVSPLCFKHQGEVTCGYPGHRLQLGRGLVVALAWGGQLCLRPPPLDVQPSAVDDQLVEALLCGGLRAGPLRELHEGTLLPADHRQRADLSKLVEVVPDNTAHTPHSTITTVSERISSPNW